MPAKLTDPAGNGGPVDLNQKIREVIPWVISNYQTQPDKCREVSFCIINELQQQPNVNAIKLLYINYYLCELIINYIDEPDVMEFFLAIFPLPLKDVYKEFLGQLLSLSICLNNKQILNALAYYLEKKELSINELEIKCFPNNLAASCSQFVTTLLDLSVYDEGESSKLYTTELLNDWLSGLNSSTDSFQINIESIVRYSLLGQGQSCSLLHYNLLELIQRKNSKPFHSAFLLSLAKRLAPLDHDSLANQKFLQFLIVVIQNQLVIDLNSKCCKTLIDHFPDNQILKLILKK